MRIRVPKSESDCPRFAYFDDTWPSRSAGAARKWAALHWIYAKSRVAPKNARKFKTRGFRSAYFNFLFCLVGSRPPPPLQLPWFLVSPGWLVCGSAIFPWTALSITGALPPGTAKQMDSSFRVHRAVKRVAGKLEIWKRQTGVGVFRGRWRINKPIELRC